MGNASRNRGARDHRRDLPADQEASHDDRGRRRDPDHRARLERQHGIRNLTSQLGVGDYQMQNFVTPQRLQDPLNSAAIEIPSGWGAAPGRGGLFQLGSGRGSGAWASGYNKQWNGPRTLLPSRDLQLGDWSEAPVSDGRGQAQTKRKETDNGSTRYQFDHGGLGGSRSLAVLGHGSLRPVHTICGAVQVFATPIGQGDPYYGNVAKTKVITNMQRGNQFPPAACLVIMQVGFYFQSQMLKSDIDLIMDNAEIEVRIDDKIYMEGQIWEFPAGVGLAGVSTQAAKPSSPTACPRLKRPGVMASTPSTSRRYSNSRWSSTSSGLPRRCRPIPSMVAALVEPSGLREGRPLQCTWFRSLMV